jgi:hypothetical protein
VFLTAPSAARETFLQACNGQPLPTHPGSPADTHGNEEEQEGDGGEGAAAEGGGGGGFQRFVSECAVKRWCAKLRLRLLGPGSSVTAVGLGRVILRIDASAAPPPPPTAVQVRATTTTSSHLKLPASVTPAPEAFNAA